MALMFCLMNFNLQRKSVEESDDYIQTKLEIYFMFPYWEINHAAPIILRNFKNKNMIGSLISFFVMLHKALLKLLS